MDATRHRETHDAGVIDDDDDNRERTEKIETRLTFTILKAGIDGEPERRLRLRHNSIRKAGKRMVKRKVRNKNYELRTRSNRRIDES